MCVAHVAALERQVKTLQRENQQLRTQAATVEQLRTEKDELANKLELAHEEIAELRRRFFARASEKLSSYELLQMRLFDEAEQALDQSELAPQEPTVQVPAHERVKAVRRALPKELPREEVLVDIAEADKKCGCGHRLVRIGQESSEKLDVIPMRMQVIRTVRPKYACHHCEGSGDERRPAVRIAAPPPTMIPKGIATPGLLAYIVTSKFCDALPLYRQEKQFARIEVELSRRTMADWMIASAAACAPLREELERRLRSGPVLQVDETTVKVMREPERANTTLRYMWVARCGHTGARHPP